MSKALHSNDNSESTSFEPNVGGQKLITPVAEVLSPYNQLSTLLALTFLEQISRGQKATS
jgi:hypothetical protein